MALDCDSDTLYTLSKTAARHTGTFSCFSTVINAEGETETSSRYSIDLIYAGKADNPAEILQMLWNNIGQKANPKEAAYRTTF